MHQTYVIKAAKTEALHPLCGKQVLGSLTYTEYQ